MYNRNGQIIMEAIQQLEKPVTADKLLGHFVESRGAETLHHVVALQECLSLHLKAGVRFGYLQRINREYFASREPPVATEVRNEPPERR